MLKFKVIEKYCPPKKTLELFNSIPNINLEITNGYARVIEKTNIKQVLIENHSPAIVSKELWDSCQRQLDKNRHGNYGKTIHIFHRVVRCPECKELMNSHFNEKLYK